MIINVVIRFSFELGDRFIPKGILPGDNDKSVTINYEISRMVNCTVVLMYVHEAECMCTFVNACMHV